MLPTQTNARTPLPEPGDLFITDAGLETELVFKDGVDLPYFSASVLLETPAGRARLSRYYRSFVDLAKRHGRGVLFESATWRISTDWAEKMGYDRTARSRINHRGIGLLQDVREAVDLPADRFVISGNIGPRFDGYTADDLMSPEAARHYHADQVGDLVDAGADVVSALTITNAPEAAGLALAAEDAGIPCVMCFTVETDGRLPSGEPLGEAIERVDGIAPDAVAYYGINCAHPTHFIDRLQRGGAWVERLGMIRANASKKSHAELDESTSLDEGDAHELAEGYAQLLTLLPNLRVLGGCCGTDLAHVTAIFARCAPAVAVG